MIVELEVGVVRRERPEPHRREELVLDGLQHGLPARLLQHRMAERDREELVGPARGRRRPRSRFDHVVEVAALVVPEPLIERRPHALGVFRHGGAPPRRRARPRPALEQTQGVVPERVDLHRLAAARRHDPVVHLGIHPRELIALRALHEQAVLRVHANAEARAPRWRSTISRASAAGARSVTRSSVARRYRSSGVEEPQASRPPCGTGPRCSPSGNMLGMRPSRTYWRTCGGSSPPRVPARWSASGPRG